MRLGVCYYPEHWPRERWPADAALMVETGLELVRLGEFAWSVYEPERGRFDWNWLDQAIEVLARAGLGIVLGTPTATPPVWLARTEPSILSVGPDGRRRAYGSRRHTCPTSAVYRAEAGRIVQALVERYGTHEAVVGWQLDNEPGNHDSARCWCEECQAAFERWLEARYGTVEALNAAWGTVFWSNTYPSFEAVRLPVPTMTSHLPALLLAHRRFSSSQTLAGLAEQRAIVAEGSPGREVLTNLYLGDLHVDAQQVGRLHGIGAVDSYPHDTSGPLEVAFVLDLARGSALDRGAGRDARGGRAWVMEQQPGRINWTPDNPEVAPGQVRQWGLQAALHGIEALLFFRWRMARVGQEQHHAALLRHDGSPTPALAEARELAAMLRELRRRGAALLERPVGEVALLWSYDDAWTIESDPHRMGLTYRELVLSAYRAARRLGLDVDVVPVDADLRGYGLVLAPALQITSPERLAALLAARDAGAIVVVGPRALIKDLDDVWVEVGLPAGLTEALGARVEDRGSSATWPPGTPGAEVEVAGTRLPVGPWVETYSVEDDAVEVLARAVGGSLDGAPVALRRDRLVAVGVSSDPAWAAVLTAITGIDAAPPHEEKFRRGPHGVVLDHERLTITVHPAD